MIREAGRLLAIAGIATAMAIAARAQVPEQQQALTLGARVVAGVGYVSQDGRSIGGPAARWTQPLPAIGATLESFSSRLSRWSPSAMDCRDQA